MQQNYQETFPYQTDEIDLKKLFESLIERKWFIFGFTFFVALLTIVYLLSLPPAPFKIKASFTKPNEISILHLNKMNHISTTQETVHSSFLEKINNKAFQINTFIEGGYLTKLNKENEPIDNVDEYISGFLSSISIKLGQLIAGKGGSFAEPNSISMQVAGAKTDISIEFLNELVAKANTETISDYISLIKQTITSRLDEISLERELLLIHTKNERLSFIDDLISSSKIARSLGIIENNFNKIRNNDTNDLNLNIAFNDNTKYPDWYLYGERALLLRIELLEDVDDEKEFPEIDKLDIETIKLKAFSIEPDSIDALQMSQLAHGKQIPNKNRMIIVIATFGGFILSIILALMISFFKEDDAQLTTKSK